MARKLGVDLRKMLVDRAQQPVPRLERLRVSECVMVEGLEDLADQVEMENCECSPEVVDVDIVSELEGWHDPWYSGPTDGSEEPEELEDLDESE